MKKNYLLIMFLCLAALYSCHKSNSTPSGPQTNVYVAGYENNGTHNVAMYWKNGIAVNLTDGSNDALASSIAVSGNDVYVAGYEYKGTQLVAKYWKNGVPVVLTDTSFNATVSFNASGIAVSGNDVYVAGSAYDMLGNSYAECWKNGKVVLSIIDDGSEANAIAISGNDVYIAGDDRGVAKYWKNGISVSVTPDPNDVYDAAAYSIAVSGNDVYVAGNIDYGAGSEFGAYWKNGTLVVLTDSSYATSARAIAVSGNDVYVAGYDLGPNATPEYWKNGALINLDLTLGNTTSVFTDGNDVYFAGSVWNGTHDVARYWKNGNPVNLSNGSKEAVANAIFVSNQL